MSCRSRRFQYDLLGIILKIDIANFQILGHTMWLEIVVKLRASCDASGLAFDHRLTELWCIH